MPAAFQPGAFQNGAFQTQLKVDGAATLPSLSASGSLAQVEGQPNAITGAATLPSLVATGVITNGEQQPRRRGGGLARTPLDDRFYFRPREAPTRRKKLELLPEPDQPLAHTEEELAELLEILAALDVAA